MRTQLDAIGPDHLEERRAFVIRRTKRRGHFGQAAADWCAEHERIPGASAAATAQGFVALGHAGLCREKARFRVGDRAARVLHAPGRYRTLREQPLGTLLLSARGLESDLALGDVGRQRRSILG